MKAEAEDAIRRYLDALRQPSSLVDHQRISEIAQALEDADDPLERVRLRQALHHAAEPDFDALAAAFVRAVPDWIREHGDDARPFLMEGVPAGVARQAGLRVAGEPARNNRSATRRRRPVRRLTYQGWLNRVPGEPFTVRQLGAAADMTSNAARVFITTALASGDLVEVGPAEDGPAQPGRIPMTYQRADRIAPPAKIARAI